LELAPQPPGFLFTMPHEGVSDDKAVGRFLDEPSGRAESVANCLKYSFLKGKEDFSLLTMNTEAIQPIQITFAS
jgi:hypothetical protein